MKTFLQQAGYILNETHKIWSKPGYTGIAYSDGDEIEQRIASIVEGASDITVLSTELRQHCTDWPSLYHLSSTRANILRPFKSSLEGDILEIGAGCGAITRYLGESGANVLALEGSPRRASIARSRTRDLGNVTVLTEKFDQFQSTQQFDVVTLIGVLEYANLFTVGDNPTLTMLERVRSLLKPNGKLIIAIENQLGLKYFAGAPEDHIGQPMYGIEGRYTKDQPQTFGREILTDMLMQAGFSTAECLAPFPDYKLPVSILTEAGINDKQFDAAAFAWQSVQRDPQLPHYPHFSLELAWPEIFKNGIALDVANSFLLIASPLEQQLVASDILAYHYSTERKADYCKETKFVHQNKEIEVIYTPLLLDVPKQIEQTVSLINYICPEKSPYVHGESLSYELIKVVRTEGWTIEQIAQLMRTYISALQQLSKETGTSLIESPYTTFSGEFFDCVPQNIIRRPGETVEFIDKEWALKENVEFGYLIFRSLLLLLGNAQRVAESDTVLPLTRSQFVKQVLGALNITLTDEDLNRYARLENAVRECVSGIDIADSSNWWPDQPLVLDSQKNQIQVLNTRIQATDNALAAAQNMAYERLEQVETLSKQIESTNTALAENLAQLNQANELIGAIKGTRIWRLLRRLGFFKNIQ